MTRPQVALRLAAAATAVATCLSLFVATTPADARTAQHRGDRGVRVTPQFFGIHDGSMQAYGRLPFGSLRIWDAQATWRNIETAPGVYDWTRLDSLVEAARAHGVEVTLVLGMTPSFAADLPSQMPRDVADFRDYVRAVMTRYRDFRGERGIAAYQVWNEGNVSTFWTGTPHQLAELTQVVHQVRNRVDPGATVVAPSFAVRLPGQRKWMAQYQSQHVGGRPVWRYYDVNGLSLYPMATYGERTGGPEDAMALLAHSRRLLARAGVPASRPIWATEINYGVRSGAPGQLAATPISARHQVANVLRTYLLGAARGLSRVFWYRYDWGQLPAAEGGGTLGNTLLTVPGLWGEVTPAGRALDTAEQWLRGRLVDGGRDRPCARNRRGTYTCVVRSRAGVRRIFWNPHRRVHVHLRGALLRQDQAGRTSVLDPRAATVKVGYRPVMILSRR